MLQLILNLLKIFKLTYFYFFPELISSKHAAVTDLIHLFPRSDGVHFPGIKRIRHGEVADITEFISLNDHYMIEEAPTYLKRSYLIFGWLKYRGDYIEPLGSLFGQPTLLAVFNSTNEEWFTLSYHEMWKLGVTCNLKYVLALDMAHALKHKQYDPENQGAHTAASAHAFIQTKRYEQSIVGNAQNNPERIKGIYDVEYQLAYQPHVGGPSGSG